MLTLRTSVNRPIEARRHQKRIPSAAAEDIESVEDDVGDLSGESEETEEVAAVRFDVGAVAGEFVVNEILRAKQRLRSAIIIIIIRLFIWRHISVIIMFVALHIKWYTSHGILINKTL